MAKRVGKSRFMDKLKDQFLRVKKRVVITASNRAEYSKGGYPKTKTGIAAQFVAQVSGHAQTLLGVKEFEPKLRRSWKRDTEAFGEYVPGDSVRNILEGKSDTITRKQLYENIDRIVESCATAVAKNCLLGITHNDIGVQNAVVTPEMKIKLIDWKDGYVLSRERVATLFSRSEHLTDDYFYGLEYFVDRVARNQREERRLRNMFHKTFMRELLGDEVNTPAPKSGSKYSTRRGPYSREKKKNPRGGGDVLHEKKWRSMRTAAEALCKEKKLNIRGRSLHELVIELHKKGVSIDFEWGE